MPESGHVVHRITCAVRSSLSTRATELLADTGVPHVLTQSGRTVRRRHTPRRFGFLGRADRLDNSPIDIYRFSIAPQISDMLIRRLATELSINLPGRGTLWLHECREIVASPWGAETPAAAPAEHLPGLLQNLALITCIMSRSGSGEELARLALELGTGVPMVSLGTGTGVRDRLGLLRITIPAEKEVVQILVPALDVEGLLRLLVEKGRLNRPGRGFIYSTPVLRGLLDTSLRIGPQEHSASMEQVIAAIDELEKSTAWRRRFPDLDPDAGFQLQHRCDEISLVCMPEQAGRYVEAAMQAGAGGATTVGLTRLRVGRMAAGARERCTIIVDHTRTTQVTESLLQVHENSESQLEGLEIQPVSLSFSHRTDASRHVRA